MKNFGYLLITIGFLIAAFYAVVDTEVVVWSKAGFGLLLGLLGVALIQISLRGKRTAVEAVRANVEKLEESLSRIADNAAKLDGEKESVDAYDFRHRIDDLFLDDLNIFVENRESIAHAFGLQAYADVMTHFAAGERYLNRCWSASTDGYIDEIKKYISRSSRQFNEALDRLRKLGGQQAGIS